MTQITNFSANPVVLPGNSEAIPAGGVLDVANWDEIKDHAVVKKFLTADADGKAVLGVGSKAAKQAEEAAPAPAGRGGSR